MEMIAHDLRLVRIFFEERRICRQVLDHESMKELVKDGVRKGLDRTHLLWIHEAREYRPDIDDQGTAQRRRIANRERRGEFLSAKALLKIPQHFAQELARGRIPDRLKLGRAPIRLLRPGGIDLVIGAFGTFAIE